MEIKRNIDTFACFEDFNHWKILARIVLPNSNFIDPQNCWLNLNTELIDNRQFGDLFQYVQFLC